MNKRVGGINTGPWMPNDSFFSRVDGYAHRRSGLILCMVCMTLWFVPLSVIPVEGQQDGPKVIINSGQEIESISRDALRAIFGMRLQSWRNDKPTRVFVLKDSHPLHQAFAKQVLNIYPHQLRLAWDRLVYSGTGQAPIQVDSEAEMLKRLKNTPGAIGYLSRSMVDDSVRTLEIQ